jgi:hypothetical protein
MNYSTLFILFVTLPLSASAPQTILLSKLNGQVIVLDETERSVHIQGVNYKAVINKEKCNEIVIGNLQTEIKNLSSKSFKHKGKDALSVNVFTQAKNISPQSPLGKFLLNFNQKMITFKSEANLACQKK